MSWYHLRDPSTEKWLVLMAFIICFALILYRNVKIQYVSLVVAAFLMVLGVLSPGSAVFQMEYLGGLGTLLGLWYARKAWIPYCSVGAHENWLFL